MLLDSNWNYFEIEKSRLGGIFIGKYSFFLFFYCLYYHLDIE